MHKTVESIVLWAGNIKYIINYCSIIKRIWQSLMRNREYIDIYKRKKG